jgi:uncharacterized protein (TIGR02246 family)
MRRALLALACAGLAIAPATPLAHGQAPSASAAERDVRAVVARYSEARDRSDAAALAALFTADADQLVSSGEWRRGRDAVVKGSLASSQQNAGKRTFTLETVRFLTADVAMADSRYDIAQADGTNRRMWASWTLVKTDGRWLIAGIRNMLPAVQRP